MQLEIDSDVFKSYGFYSGLLAMKMLTMAFLTARQRFSKNVFANPEDTKKGAKPVLNDPDVERVRRAHLNDMENIFVFFPLAFLFCLTNPAVSVATNIFRVFTLARYIHTLVYAVWVVPQPTRALAFFVGHIINIYMAFSVLLYFK